MSGFEGDVPVTGLWSSSTPYVVFAPAKQGADANPVIKFQPLRADRTANGLPQVFALPATTLSVSLVSSTLRNGKVGLLWHGVKSTAGSTPNDALQFAETDLLGTAATTQTLFETSVGTPYPEDSSLVFVAPSDTTNYAMMKFGGTPDAWKGYAGDPTTATMNSSALSNSPVDVDGSVARLGDTVFVTGRNCSYMAGACAKHLTLQRYSTLDLSALGDNSQLSTNAYSGLVNIVYDDKSTTPPRYFSPALGVLGTNLVVFWNENTATGLQLVRTLLNESGAYQLNAPVTTLMTTSATTALIPKAVVGFVDGGGVLIAARASANSADAYELVAQRFDAVLNLVGAVYTLSEPRVGEPTGVEAHVDSTGKRAIVTLRHGGYSQYTLLHAGLCQATS